MVPYCPIHQIELAIDLYYTDRGLGKIASLYCDVCNKVIIKFSEDDLSELYERVGRKARAKYKNHAKGF